jgi:tetratricopeptide (TPR) repeat protein
VGRYSEAEPLLLRAIATEPDHSRPRCQLAFVYLEIGKPREALKMATSAAALAPESEWPHRLRSLALQQLKSRKAALREARESVRLDATNYMAQLCLAQALLGSHQLDEAEKVGKNARGLQPQSAAAFEVLGQIALRRRDWLEADQLFHEALALDPLSFVAMHNLGAALKGQGRKKEAIEAFEAAAKLNPKIQLTQKSLFATTRQFQNISWQALAVLPLLGIALLLVQANYLLPGMAVLILAIAGVFVLEFGIATQRLQKLSRTVQQFYAAERPREAKRLRRRYGLIWLVATLILLAILAAYFVHPWR